MILGIGIDTVEVGRFSQWHLLSGHRLERIFSEQEIAYCLAIPAKSAERFAVRFAAREAFFKALGYEHSRHIPFLTLCKKVSVVKKNGDPTPYLQVDWHAFPSLYDKNIESFLSLTHTNSVATALVLLQCNFK